jgi:hypothetical protein
MENIYKWWFDELVHQWLRAYYWHYWLAGNMDDIISAGITLNGIRPANLCQPQKNKKS